MNFEAHGLRYIRTARKGTCECIAIRGGRSGKPKGFSHRERSDCDTFARPLPRCANVSQSERCEGPDCDTFARPLPRRANVSQSVHLEVQKHKVFCTPSSSTASRAVSEIRRNTILNDFRVTSCRSVCKKCPVFELRGARTAIHSHGEERDVRMYRDPWRSKWKT